MSQREPAGRVLALRALGLGDLLTAVPALRALADFFPGGELVLATTPAMHPLARAAGLADAVVAAEPLSPLDASRRRPAVAVNLHGKGPRSHEVLAALAPDRLVAFACGPFAGPAWRADEHEVARWCRLLEESGVPADPRRLDVDLPPDPAPVPVPAGATVVHPGAAFPARRWPAPRWAAVARAEAAAGRPVVVTGGPGEVALARRVAAGAGLGPGAVWAGRTDVVGLARLVAGAGRVVCGDTGVAHLATALGRPSVVLFGPVPPAWWGPPPDRPWHVALWAGRLGDPHGRAPDPGLLEISVDDVLAALAGLPPAPPRRPEAPAATGRTVARR